MYLTLEDPFSGAYIYKGARNAVSLVQKYLMLPDWSL